MKGRKRHIVVDIMGNLLAVIVHAANIHDTKAGINPARQAFQIRQSKDSAEMKAGANHLRKM